MTEPTVTPLVTAVIVTYRSVGVVDAALRALRSGAEEGFLRCVVVDNQSPDGTADAVARDHPWAQLIRSPENLGYGRGCNLGFSQVTTPYVLFMNPDVVFEAAEIRRLVRFMEERPSAGMAAPSTCLSSGDFQHAGGLATPGSICAASLGLVRSASFRQVTPGSEPFTTDWLCGAIMLLPSALVRELGGFDPRFFLYFEETDLCVRVRRAGRDLWAVGGVSAKHVGGASAKAANPALRSGDCLAEFYFPSRYYYLTKHHGRLAAFATEGFQLAVLGVRDFLRMLLFRPSKKELRTRLKAPLFVPPPPAP
jgi:GT2 family glycosyltransferase